MMRLRQIALVTPELRPVERQICDQLGLEVCYRDPGLAYFGLRHGLYAIGDQLLEVVALKQPGTTAGRFLERRGGEGGYMVLLQTDDVEAGRRIPFPCFPMLVYWLSHSSNIHRCKCILINIIETNFVMHLRKF